MTYNKRKKNSRLHGSKTHGYGSKKKHRGAGNRGGRGLAGTGKRADQKKPSIWKNTKYFGKYGFKNPNSKKVSSVNTFFLMDKFNTLLKKGLLKQEGDAYSIDLGKMGINKLLSKGKVTKKFIVKVDSATKTAVKNIENAGGKVILKSKSGEE